MLQDELPLPQKLAIAHSSLADRRIIEPFFLLDNRLAQFVSHSKEPVLTQMRIAWWRDQFGKPAQDRPEGDPVLDALSRHWRGEETALIALVDGWETLLAEPPLPDNASREFAAGRGHCFAAITRLLTLPDFEQSAMNAGMRWAYADLISRMSDQDEVEFVLSQAEVPPVGGISLPYKLRSLLILNTLSNKPLANSGGALIESKRDILTVMRVGLLGR